MILSFGEALLRFAPLLGGKWIEQSSIQTYIGGAVLNVAFALAKWNTKVRYLTALPDNYFAAEIIGYIGKHNIDTSCIIKSSGRIGSYYLPVGDDFKDKGVIYDRNDSAFSKLHIEQVDFDVIFKDITWFHLSAICPALNQNIANLSAALLKEAKHRKITTSIDFNYRSKLWQYGVKPIEVMQEITQYCDVLMGNIWAIESMLEIKVDQKSIDGNDYINATQSCIKTLKENYPNLDTIAFTYRFDKVTEPYYFATLYQNDELVLSDRFQIKAIVDKVGSGDCFMAALIYGKINNWTSIETVNLCVKAAINKLGELGDHTNTELSEIT